MHKAYEVFGLLEDDAEVEATVHDLREHGIRPEEIEVRTPAAGRYELADERLHDDIVGLEHGAIVGGLVGAMVGLLAGFGPMESLGVAAMLLIIGFFTGMGALVGGMAGMQDREPHDDDPIRTRDVIAPDGARLIAVRADRRTGRAHRILERHGALFVDELAPHT